MERRFSKHQSGQCLKEGNQREERVVPPAFCPLYYQHLILKSTSTQGSLSGMEGTVQWEKEKT